MHVLQLLTKLPVGHMKMSTAILMIFFAFVLSASSQIYDTNAAVAQTFVGSGFQGNVDGRGMETMFNGPTSISTDRLGNFFVLDYESRRIRKITPDGVVATIVGQGSAEPPGLGVSLSLQSFNPHSLAVDHTGVVWITAFQLQSQSGKRLLRVDPNGYVTRIVGIENGIFSGICVDSANRLYVADEFANKVYRYHTNGVWEVFAGSGNSGSIDGNGIFSSFSFPGALAVDAADNVYVWDAGGRLIRRISQSREVTTLAGKYAVSVDSDGAAGDASFSYADGMAVDHAGNVYLAARTSVRKLTAATNTFTVAGSFSQSGFTNGIGELARFRRASGICVSNGVIYVADREDHRVRTVSYNPAPIPVAGGNLQLNTFAGIQIEGVVGRTYRIESSLDMEDWSVEATVLLTHSPYTWIDHTAVTVRKFYRGFLLP